MGRVYNAMKRAEQFNERARPIGRPASGFADAVRQDASRAASQSSLDSASAATPFSFEEEVLFNFDEAATLPPLDFNDAAASVEPGWKATAPGSPHLYVAPPPPPALAFTEPRQTVGIRDLNIDPHLATLTGEDALACERYRTLAVRLLNMAARRKLNSLIVTSAEEGEGKSTIAASLAWVMAKQSDRRVLLIDADTRRPSISRMLGLKPQRGWFDLAEGRAQLADVAVRIDPNGLYVLSARPARETKEAASSDATSAGAQTGEARGLASLRIEKLLGDLGKLFDFIIIDAPPITEFADTQRLASIVDGAVLAVRAGRTHPNAVTGALKLVPKERRLGVVLNQSPLDEGVIYRSRKKSGFGRFFGKKW